MPDPLPRPSSAPYGLEPPQIAAMTAQAGDIALIAAALKEALEAGQLDRLATRLTQLANDACYLASYVPARYRIEAREAERADV